MYAILNGKTTLFVAEQARYGDLDAQKELAWLLIARRDRRFHNQFLKCTAAFTARFWRKCILPQALLHWRAGSAKIHESQTDPD
jgi:hypothetical protein